ncbi:MAG: M15 family metallopeptidase [Treponema sp.]|nr:M15 family metallopeptidase [Treponema sp.]
MKQLIAICFILTSGIAFANVTGPQPTRAEQIVRAIHAAHPQRISRAEFRNGDWAVLLNETWFYYAEGRMLPRALLYRVSRYRPIAIYFYPRELAPWTPPTPEQAAHFRGIGTARAAQLPRSPHFFNALYRAHTREEAYRQLRRVRFFGHQVQIHYAIIEPLTLIEERVRAAAETDSSVRTWINNIDRMYGWVWRNIGGTQSRSFHSYGIAIDIMPRSTGGRAVYWRWAGPEWWNIPHERRYHPPPVVIQAFEAYGFIWGGKWSIFDTIHFEFRPELLLFNNFTLEHLGR